MGFLLRPFVLEKRPPVGHATLLAVGLAVLATLTAALAGTGVGAEAIDRMSFALAREPGRRADALVRLAANGGSAVLERTLESEQDPRVLAIALELSAGMPFVAAALPSRLERETPGSPAALVLLRAAAAQADERALVAATRFLRDPRSNRSERGAAFTALAAISARHGLGVAPVPRLSRAEEGIVFELSRSVDGDAPGWRMDALRALAKRAGTRRDLLALERARLRELDDRSLSGEKLEAEELERQDLFAFFALRGDGSVLAKHGPEDRERRELFAPTETLAATDPSELDELLELDGWGGAASWRMLEATAADPAGREALLAALDRAAARDDEALLRKPAVVASLVLLATGGDERSRELLVLVLDSSKTDETVDLWARSALGWIPLDDPAKLERLAATGTLERLPPPLVLRAVRSLGPRAVPALVRAAGEPSGRLVRVLEPGAGTGRERFLLDLAVASDSPERDRR